MLLKYAQTRLCRIPDRAHATDAGLDFFMPEFTESFLNDLTANPVNKGIAISKVEKIVRLPAHKSILIPSGIKIEVPYGYMALFLNKSGVAAKKNLLIGSQVIDTFYSGEVHVNLHNVSDEDVSIAEGEKLVQLVFIPILTCEPTLVDEQELYDWMMQDQTRGAGGFGSSNQKAK
jgi:dUTP pyrophosphatase